MQNSARLQPRHRKLKVKKWLNRDLHWQRSFQGNHRSCNPYLSKPAKRAKTLALPNRRRSRSREYRLHMRENLLYSKVVQIIIPISHQFQTENGRMKATSLYFRFCYANFRAWTEARRRRRGDEGAATKARRRRRGDEGAATKARRRRRGDEGAATDSRSTSWGSIRLRQSKGLARSCAAASRNCIVCVMWASRWVSMRGVG